MIVTSFSPLCLKGRELLPIIQGGMAVGVSASRLAGSVARLGGVGTIGSVDLRQLHPDLMERSTRAPGHIGGALKGAINAANLVALDREVRAAKEIAQRRGMIAVNVMRAISENKAYVKQACESGADAIVMGAGLPLDLPEMVADYPHVALIPVLSDVRGISLLVKKWQRKGRLPDAIVIEHPRYSGGHLGASRLEDICDPRFDFETVLPGVIAALEGMGIDPASVPLIPAGGINSFEKVQKLLALGAAAVQVGTPFAVTEEGDAHPNFKRVLADARPEDIVAFMSVAGLPVRAVRTPWLTNYLKRSEKLCAATTGKTHKCAQAWDCLISCGQRDSLPKAGQFCIANQLAAALRGDVEKGLFFRGAESLPFGQEIRPVRELIDYLLSGKVRQVA